MMMTTTMHGDEGRGQNPKQAPRSQHRLPRVTPVFVEAGVVGRAVDCLGGCCRESGKKRLS